MGDVYKGIVTRETQRVRDGSELLDQTFSETHFNSEKSNIAHHAVNLLIPHKNASQTQGISSNINCLVRVPLKFNKYYLWS